MVAINCGSPNTSKKKSVSVMKYMLLLRTSTSSLHRTNIKQISVPNHTLKFMSKLLVPTPALVAPSVSHSGPAAPLSPATSPSHVSRTAMFYISWQCSTSVNAGGATCRRRVSSGTDFSTRRCPTIFRHETSHHSLS